MSHTSRAFIEEVMHAIYRKRELDRLRALDLNPKGHTISEAEFAYDAAADNVVQMIHGFAQDEVDAHAIRNSQDHP